MLPCLEIEWCEPAIESDCETPPRPCDRSDKTPAFLERQRHRLLCEHMLARIECCLCLLSMLLIPARDQHRIDRRVAQHVVVVCIARGRSEAERVALTPRTAR